MVRHFFQDPPLSPADGPASLTWLQRFQRSLEAECLQYFGADWQVTTHPERLKACVSQRAAHKGPLCVALHPGLHVVTPLFAARRIAQQLHANAIYQGLISTS